MKKVILLAGLFLLAASGCLAASPAAPAVTVPLRFDHYYDYDMVVASLKALNKAYPELTRLEEIGRSEENRAIYCLTVFNPATGAELEKPGIYVDGNIHGNEIQAGEVSLYLLNYLLTNYGRNDEITKLVDTRCFYIVPVVNVDGRYHFFADANTSSSGRSIRIPRDDDNDGLLDEDFPDDLDGDGSICQMRKKDPFGRMKTDPEDRRLMIPVKPGELGEWTVLGYEGIDNDGDGRINEDSEGYLDGNRNWGYDWMPPYVQSGAGNFPFEGRGLKAIAAFIMTKSNICVTWALHNSGGMILRGPSTKTQGEYNPSDVAVYDRLGKEAEKIIPGYRYMVSWKDLYTTYGDFVEWTVMTRGAYGFVAELFRSEEERYGFKPVPEKKEGDEADDDTPRFGGDPSVTRARLQFSDHLTQGELYKSWKPYNHPVYGEIEIGGWVKMSSRLPAPFMLEDLVHRNASAIIFSAKQTPSVTMDVFEVKAAGPDLYQVRVRLVNANAIPTMSHHAQQVRLYPKDMLTVTGAGAKVLAGGPLTNLYTGEANYKEYRPEVQFLVVPGYGKVEYQFLVAGRGEVVIRYESRHGGKLAKTAVLK